MSTLNFIRIRNDSDIVVDTEINYAYDDSATVILTKGAGVALTKIEVGPTDNPTKVTSIESITFPPLGTEFCNPGYFVVSGGTWNGSAFIPNSSDGMVLTSTFSFDIAGTEPFADVHIDIQDVEGSSSSSSTSSSSQSSSSSESSSSVSSSKSSSSASTAERIHFWHYVLNEEGQPIQNAEIRLYLQSAPTTEANIYLSEGAATSTTCSVADIKTDNDGYFEFWLEGETGTGGYAHTTEFILEWYKAGTAPGYIYNYNPWPNALVWRDTNIGADRDYRNKFVSNYLANKWFGHANAIVPSASPHDLQPVDYESGCTDNTYNKVVSNKFLFDILVGCGAGDTFDLSSIYDSVQEHQELVSSWTTSGSLYVKDITHAGVTGDTVVRMVKTTGYEEIVPAVVTRLSSTSTRVAIDENIEVYVTIQGSA